MSEQEEKEEKRGGAREEEKIIWLHPKDWTERRGEGEDNFTF